MLIDVAGRKPPQAKGRSAIRIGHDHLDLSALEQLVDDSQTRSIAALLPEVARHLDRGEDVRAACEAALRAWPKGTSGRLARPRPQELLFAVSHLR